MGFINTLLEAGEMLPTIIVAAVLAAIIVFIVINIRVVRQATAMVVECFGKYRATWYTGLHFMIPFVERVANKVSLMEQVVDFENPAVITKDNVRMDIDTVVFYQITDPKLFTYGIANPLAALENITVTTTRNIIGELDLDQTLASREFINTKLRGVLDDATDSWGFKVTRVELKSILPTQGVLDAMEAQMKAERERRAMVLTAEGEKESTILVAEGQKRKEILAAEADKEAAILRAQAARESRIEEAEGDAEAILLVQDATAKGIQMINESEPGEAVLTIKSLEAFAKAADGQATKIIIPSNIQGIAGLANALAESVTDPK